MAWSNFLVKSLLMEHTAAEFFKNSSVNSDQNFAHKSSRLLQNTYFGSLISTSGKIYKQVLLDYKTTNIKMEYRNVISKLKSCRMYSALPYSICIFIQVYSYLFNSMRGPTSRSKKTKLTDQLRTKLNRICVPFQRFHKSILPLK